MFEPKIGDPVCYYAVLSDEIRPGVLRAVHANGALVEVEGPPTLKGEPRYVAIDRSQLIDPTTIPAPSAPAPLQSQFLPGSVVVLKSGSAPMVVENIPRTDGLVSVVWMYQGEVRRDAFEMDALILAGEA